MVGQKRTGDNALHQSEAPSAVLNKAKGVEYQIVPSQVKKSKRASYYTGSQRSPVTTRSREQKEKPAQNTNSTKASLYTSLKECAEGEWKKRQRNLRPNQQEEEIIDLDSPNTENHKKLSPRELFKQRKKYTNDAGDEFN